MSRAAEYQDFGFPDVEEALTEPNGLLAVGGDLSPARLLYAYRHGIFPWYSHDQPILWWSPDPRSVLFPERFQLRRSLSKRMRNAGFELRVDTCFADVMRACAAPRKGADGTWINADMLNAYTRLHQLGIAHSVETWQDGRLVGGLYGLALGRAFFGESMFSQVADASKVALAHLVQGQGPGRFDLVDCQVQSPHLDSLGAVNIPRRDFIALIKRLTQTGNTVSLA
ncbi:MAG: leucyl/phenylalanyl-tRNA--protein transferase [Chromatiales bacterium]|nr:leucyl/phenylalanyl-tRNA--protein transferase [Chromatiales bacterium]